jgi:hypothetical protein
VASPVLQKLAKKQKVVQQLDQEAQDRLTEYLTVLILFSVLLFLILASISH